MELVKVRAALMSAVFEQNAGSLPSAAKMAVFLTDLATMRGVIEEYKAIHGQDVFLDISLSNSHKKTFVSGSPEQLRQVQAAHQFREWAKLHKAVPSLVTNMSDAYHCRILSQAKRDFRDRIAGFAFREPRYPLYRNCDARPYSRQTIVEGLCDHFDHTVLFHASVVGAVEANQSRGLQTRFVDVGSNSFLSKCVQDLEAELHTKFDKQSIDS